MKLERFRQLPGVGVCLFLLVLLHSSACIEMPSTSNQGNDNSPKNVDDDDGMVNDNQATSPNRNENDNGNDANDNSEEDFDDQKNDNDNGDDNGGEPSPGRFRLDIEIVGEGRVDPSFGDFEAGESVELLAIADDGWRFDRWEGGVTGQENPTTLTVNAVTTIRAIFIQQFTLELEVGGPGEVELMPEGNVYDRGTMVVAMAIPDPGANFLGWIGDLSDRGDAAMITIAMNSNVNAGANFARPPSGGGGGGGAGPGGGDPPIPPDPNPVLTVSTVGNGAVTVNPLGTPVVTEAGPGWEYAPGTMVNLTAVAGMDACFQGWDGDLTGDEAVQTIELTDETEILSVFADFLDLTGPPPAPVIEAETMVSGSTTVPLGVLFDSCQADGVAMFEVSGPGGVTLIDVPEHGGEQEIEIDAPLSPNRINALRVTTISTTGQRSAPSSLTVIHDERPPSLFIDFPANGAEVTTPIIDVAGRVGDQLSGFAGLSVTVNGVDAAVDPGIGTNGTFLASPVPLTVGLNTISAVATDALGNMRTRQIEITLVEIADDAPRMMVIGGNAQAGSVNSVLPSPIMVHVTHPDGSAFANKIVTFSVTRSDGRLFAAPPAVGEEGGSMIQVRTDDLGMAGAYWKLGSDAGCGNNRVSVRSMSIAGTVEFCASAGSAPPGQINIGSGNMQRVEVGAIAPEPLRIWVSDSCNGVSGVPVTFQVVEGGGRVNGNHQAVVVTSETGHAEVVFRLGLAPGNQRVRVDFPGNPTGPAEFVIFGLLRDPTMPTSFSGLVIDNGNKPIGGAECRLIVGSTVVGPVMSSPDGQFRFDNLAIFGPAALEVDGATATTLDGGALPAGVSFPGLHFEIVITPNVENTLPMPVLLPPLNTANEVVFDGVSDAVLRVQEIEGLEIRVVGSATTTGLTPTVITNGAGVPVPLPITFALNQVHHDDVPMPMPDGAAPPFAWTMQPAGLHFDPPLPITYPNMSGLPAGSIAYFLSFDHDTNRFEIVASGQVTEDGSCIESDADAGLTVSGWGCNCPPYSVTGDCCDCGPCEECVGGSCVEPAGIECCDGVEIDPASHGCCDGTVYELATQGCCDQPVFDGRVYDLASQCCVTESGILYGTLVDKHPIPLGALQLGVCPNPVPTVHESGPGGAWEFEYDGCSLPSSFGLNVCDENSTLVLGLGGPGAVCLIDFDCGAGTCIDLDVCNPQGGSTSHFSGVASCGTVSHTPPGSFRPCDEHDECYQMCGSSRLSCDTAMLNGMRGVCMSVPVAENARANCLAWADIYYRGLRMFGGIAHDGRQRQVCDCCACP
jgi:hypothetical protein